jgi:putative nucleotidyltransferase with HDIG domain
MSELTIDKETRSATVLAALPEIDLIADADIRKKTLDAFLLAWELGGWESWEAASYWLSWLRKENLGIEFVRSSTRIAIAVANVMREISKVDLNLDCLISGALLRDVGKLLEKAPRDQGKLTTSLIRHPFSGVHVALTVGLPLEVVHIISAHGPEGTFTRRTAEATIVVYAEKLAIDPILRREKDLTVDEFVPTITLLHTSIWDHLHESWGGWIGPRDATMK